MGFGVLEPVGTKFPPGTVLLEDISQQGEATQIILVPKPSASPKDPLNWSRLKKEITFATIICGSCTCGAIGPVLVPGFNIVAADLGVTLTQVAVLNGALIMGLGFGVYCCSALATVYGNRLMFLLTTLLLVPVCCWGAAAASYDSLLAARVFQGIGMGSWWGE
jgi:MFS family permease